jgi:hypothetical protein
MASPRSPYVLSADVHTPPHARRHAHAEVLNAYRTLLSVRREPQAGTRDQGEALPWFRWLRTWVRRELTAWPT